MLCCDMSEHHFLIRGHDQAHHARHYLSGLRGTQRRKNLERIEADVAQSDYEGMQQFISNSPWDHRAVMRQVAQRAETALGGAEDTALYLDETAFVKKGRASVGVQRQYCGRLGKLENCQVGVFAALGCGSRMLPAPKSHEAFDFYLEARTERPSSGKMVSATTAIEDAFQQVTLGQAGLALRMRATNVLAFRLYGTQARRPHIRPSACFESARMRTLRTHRLLSPVAARITAWHFPAK